MTTPEPDLPPPSALDWLLREYEIGRITADVAVKRYLDELQRTGGSHAAELDRPFREALLKELIVRGKVPPDTVLDPEE
jgi:hypothetical protein